MNTSTRLGAALSLIGLVACGDPLVGDWKGDNLSFTILEPEDGKYPFTGSITILARECALDGDLVDRVCGEDLLGRLDQGVDCALLAWIHHHPSSYNHCKKPRPDATVPLTKVV